MSFNSFLLTYLSYFMCKNTSINTSQLKSTENITISRQFVSFLDESFAL